MAQGEVTFGDDIAASLAVWKTAPALPLITAALAILFDLPDVVDPAATLISLPAILLLTGFAGTQRIWYLRVFRGRTLARDLVWPMTLAFMGRFIVLGFLVGIPFALFVVPLLLSVSGVGSRALVTVPLVLVGDFIGTFITAALAFSTKHVFEAVSIGWQTLWSGWPATAPYAVVAPLVVIALGQTLGRTAGGAASVAVELVGTLLALLCKGATTAYYLRVHEVGEYGAAAAQ
ncbi:MAG: hypothetical protein JO248_01415 [Acidimicrobiia bacterium]|nr:hypothetical protein [Acidimicrobiia bacterium]